jgi:HPt (histidine-containing phosphotransfer) domain-containing protein
MSDFLAKPIDVDELWGVLTCWLPPRQSITPLACPPPRHSVTEIPAWLRDAAIDVETALQRFLGDIAALENGVTIFSRQHAAAGERLASALAEGNHAAFVQTAHAVMGGAAIIGADELAALCRQAEKLSAAEWERAAPAIIREITNQLIRLAPPPADVRPVPPG